MLTDKEVAQITNATGKSFKETLHGIIFISKYFKCNINFIKPPHPNRIMQRLRRLFSRARLEETEINILRGILKEVEKNTGS